MGAESRKPLMVFMGGARAIAENPTLPDWLKRESLYDGTAFPGDEDALAPIARNTVGAIKAPAVASGKVTAHFAKALCRALQVNHPQIDKDGYGINDKFCIAEYTDSPSFTYGAQVGSGTTMFILYNRDINIFSAMQNGFNVFSQADAAKAQPTPFLFALWPLFLQNEEFAQAFQTVETELSSGTGDEVVMQKAACRMADAAYYMLRGANTDDDKAIIKAIMPTNSTLKTLTSTMMSAKSIHPDTYAGVFSGFAFQGNGKKRSRKKKVTMKEFCGKYADDERKLTKAEQTLVPKLGDEYVLPHEIETICEHISVSTKNKNISPIRNILLRGEPGTGKTEGARAIAAGLGLPYVFVTCNANTEIYDLLGQMLPVMSEKLQPRYAQSELFKMLPSKLEMEMDPESAYDAIETVLLHANLEALVSKMPTANDMADVDKAYKRMETEIAKTYAATEGSNAQQGFVYVESPLVKAFRYGWVVELQEPSLISNPAVLPGLNGLMDTTQAVVLPTGETVPRHPDTVIISTTNVDLEGCRPLNQSFVDRHQLKLNMDLPTDDVIIERVKALTHCDENVDLYGMLDVFHQMQAVIARQGLTDGALGVRAITDWVISYMITGSYIESAAMTIIPSATTDRDGIHELTACVTAKFSN